VPRDLDIGMDRQHLVMYAADPVAAQSDLPVRQRHQITAERSAELSEHILNRVQRNAADQQQVLAHVPSPPPSSAGFPSVTPTLTIICAVSCAMNVAPTFLGSN
jgi:hypothetical protein